MYVDFNHFPLFGPLCSVAIIRLMFSLIVCDACFYVAFGVCLGLSLLLMLLNTVLFIVIVFLLCVVHYVCYYVCYVCILWLLPT